jgi:hypothetical protein
MTTAYNRGKRDGYRVAALNRALLEGVQDENDASEVEAYAQGYSDGQDEYMQGRGMTVHKTSAVGRSELVRDEEGETDMQPKLPKGYKPGKPPTGGSSIERPPTLAFGIRMVGDKLLSIDLLKGEGK